MSLFKTFRFFSASSAGASQLRILITGACGQVGMGLVAKLGSDNTVFLADVRSPEDEGNYRFLDVTKKTALHRVVKETKPDWVIHLPALLSGAGEQNPDKAIDINVGGFINILRLSRLYGFRLFVPSSIAVYGASSTRQNTREDTITRPSTIYGITKVHMEMVGDYFARKFGVDFRSLRLPGVLSANVLNGKGTTDYAVEMIRSASRKEPYSCFLAANTRLPMLHIDDCLEGITKFLKINSSQLSRRVYNITSMSFTPAELSVAIERVLGRKIDVIYKPDFRQHIADTWPESINDDLARRDWGWDPSLDLEGTVKNILDGLDQQLE